MLIKKYDTVEMWLADRPGRITGSKLPDIYSPKVASKAELQKALDASKVAYKKSATIAQLEEVLPEDAKRQLFETAPKKMAVYELIADRLALPPEAYEDPRGYGHRMEPQAIKALSEHLGVEFNTDLVMWISEENENVAVSPDGYKEDLTESAEAKCLKASLHIKVALEKTIPSDYYEQGIQPFIVNPKLQKHHFVFYNPYIIARPMTVITITRDQVAEDIAMYHEYQLAILDWVNRKVEELSF